MKYNILVYVYDPFWKSSGELGFGLVTFIIIVSFIQSIISGKEYFKLLKELRVLENEYHELKNGQKTFKQKIKKHRYKLNYSWNHFSALIVIIVLLTVIDFLIIFSFFRK